MANNVSVKDSGGNAIAMKTTDTESVHTPHQNIDSLPDVTQATHDSLNANVTIQVGDTDVSSANPVPVSDAGGALTVDGTVTANLSATDNAVLDDIAAKLGTIDADTSSLFGTVSGTELQVDVVAALPAGSNAIGKLAANSGVDIGDVDVTSMPTGASATAVQGTVAHDSAVAQNPIQIGGEARSTERGAVASGDVSRLVTDLAGKLINLPYANPENFIKGATAAITDTTRTAIIAAQGAGVKIYVTQLLVTNGDADTSTLVTIESATTAIYSGWAQAAGGGFSISFPVPIATAANEALNATCGTSGATVYVSASGYKGQ